MTNATKPLESISEETQNELVEMLPVFIRTLNLLKLVGDTMTEETISVITEKVEKSADLINYLGDERVTKLLDVVLNNADQLVELLDKVMILQKNGTIDKLLELGEALGVLTDSLTETSIKHLTERLVPLIEIGDKVASSSLIKNTPNMIDAFEKTVDETKGKTPPAMSVFGLLKILKEKEMQEAIHFGLTFLKNMNQK